MGKSGMLSAGLFQTKLASFSSYVIGAKVRKNALPYASFCDTSLPYYYLRVDPGESSDYVIFGGQDHKTGQDDHPVRCYENLEEVLHQFIPDARVDCRWSGQVIETNDGLPFIGETAEHQFVATGFAGNGMTFGTLAGMMARDAVLGQANAWSRLFAPARKKLRGGTWRYMKENVDYPLYLLKDRLRPKPHSPHSIGAGEGQVIRLDGRPVACSRDKAGKLTKVSAVCTHLGCLVRWNSAERTWDCPCHGSRFHPDGQVLAGPAEDPLEPVRAKKQTTPAGADQRPKRKR
jgi:Rieske Fe-S protein